MAPKEDDNLQKTVEKLAEIFSNIKTEEDLHTQVAIIKSHYVKKDDITKMVWDAIKENQETQKRGRINWLIILQVVIAAIILAALGAIFHSQGAK